MPAHQNDNTVALWRLLPSGDRPVLRQVYDALSLPRDLANLEADVLDLISMLETARELHLEGPPGWLDTLVRLRQKIIERRDDLGPFPRTLRKPRTGNRYDGQFHDHAVIGCLVQEFRPRANRGSLSRVSSLLKVALINAASRDPGSARVVRLADEFRRMSRRGKAGYEILEQIEPLMDRADPLQEARNLLLAYKVGSSDEAVKEAVRTFMALLADGPSSRKPASRNLSPHPAGAKRRVLFSIERERPDDGKLPGPRQIAVLDDRGESEAGSNSGVVPEVLIYNRADDVSPGQLLTPHQIECAEHRYSNYRTAIDNQRLPYAWDALNPLEQEQLTSYLLRELKDAQSKRKPEALGLLCMLIMGKRVDELIGIPLRSASDKDYFEAPSQWTRHLSDPPHAYMPDEAVAEVLLPSVRSIPLPIPDLIAEQLAVIFAQSSESFGEALEKILEVPLGDFEARLRQFLSELRAMGQGRITLGRISNSLPAAMMQVCGDKVLTHFMTGRESDLPATGVYYGHYPLEYCATVYKRSLELMFSSPLFGLDVDLPAVAVGSRLAVSDESITGFVHRLREAIGESGLELNEIHNRYAMYSYMMLSFCSGHRPVSDPHHDLDTFDLERGLCLISDKAVDSSKTCRLVALPGRATEQMKEYLSHLRALSARLIDRHHSLAEKIYAVTLPGGPRPLPLFFFLTDQYEPVGISRAELERMLSRYWALPPNCNRHIVYSYLAGTCLLPEYAEAHLGHAENGCLALGPYSILAPHTLSSVMAPKLEAYLERYGWCVVSGLSVYRNRGYQAIERRAQRLLSTKLGPQIRHERRVQRFADESRRIDLIIKPYIQNPEREIGIEELRSMVGALTDGENESGHMFPYRYTLLRRKLISLRRRGYKTAIPGRLARASPDLSPHNLESLKDAKRFDALREAFPQILSQRSEAAPDFTLEARLAEILVSAILYDAMLYPRAIEGLARGWPLNVHRVNDIVAVDIDLNMGIGKAVIRRWLPTGISLALLIGLLTRWGGAGTVDPKKLRTECAALLSDLGLQCEGRKERSARSGIAALFAPLLRLGDQYWSTYLPSVLHQYALGNHLAPSLTQSSWFRLLTGQCLALWNNDEPVVRELFADPASRMLLERVKTPNHAMGRAFYKQLCHIVRMKNDFRGKRVRNSVSRSHIRDQVSALIRSTEKDVPAIARYLAAWTLHMAKHGTPRTDAPARATIDKYLSTIGGLLIEYCHQDDFIRLGEADLTERYRLVVESAGLSDKDDVIGYLRNFHEFMRAAAQIAVVDWQDIAPEGPRDVLSADPGLILRHEYDRALGIVLSTEDRLPVTRTAALFLLFGYHFGLRPEEVMRLRRRDIQIVSGRIVLVVRSTLEGDTKTRNGIRQVPTTEPMTAEEMSLVHQWMEHLAAYEQPISAPILRLQAELRNYPRERPEQLALYALRSATGDPEIRLHHLRHSLGTRIATSLLSDALSGDPQLGVPCDTVLHRIRGVNYGRSVARTLLGREGPSRRALYALGLAMGHSRPAMSLNSYVHLMDVQLAHCAHQQTCVEFSNRVLAYAHGMTENNYTVRKFRNRGDVRGGALVTGVEVIPELDLPVQKAAAVHRQAAISRSEPLTLEAIDRMLCKIAQQDGQVPGVAAAFFVDDSVVEQVVVSASALQNRSGYDEFRVPEEAPITYANEWPSSAFRRETRRARELLSDLHGGMTRAKNYDFDRCRALVHLWADAHHPRSPQLVFTDLNRMSEFKKHVSLLGMHPEDIEIVLPPQTAYTIDELADDSGVSIRQSAKLARVVDKRRNRQHVRIGLGKRRGAAAGIYAGTVHRTVFVLGVWLSIQERRSA